MDDRAHAPHAESGDDFEIEVTDLRRSGGSDGTSGGSTDLADVLSGRRRLSRRQRLWRLASAVGVVTLGLLVTALGTRGVLVIRRIAPPSPQPVALGLQVGDLACLDDVAWSPGGERVALLGYRQGCPGGGIAAEPGLLSIDDARTGRVVAHFQPDAAILRMLHARFPRVFDTAGPASAGTGPPAIAYDYLLWSPDGRRLALTFFCFAPALGPQTLAGVALMSAQIGNEQVMMQPVSELGDVIEWDLQRGTIVSGAAAGADLPPALAYRWGADGALIPTTPLSADVAPASSRPGPVGNPDGASSFTIWQPGGAALTMQLSLQGVVPVPGVYTFSTAFAAWSPDERYLVDAVSLEGRFEPPGRPLPRRQTLTDFSLGRAPILPVRDQALLRVLDELSATTQIPADPDAQTVAIAWRPDGRVLAVHHPGGRTVDLYDCVTGRQLASLPVPTGGRISFTRYVLLLWSPDGSRLLLLDAYTGPAALWGPGQLPR